jgi:photosystem II stability/assembly factor-like uncharacterized protein
MLIDPENSDRLILGTERLGVQVSDDGGQTYRASNQGFSHRRIVDAAVDPQHPERAIVVLTSNFEPLLQTTDSGRTWAPLATGLKSGPPRHVFASPDGWFSAPVPGGLLRYDTSKASWVPVNQIVQKTSPAKTKRAASVKKISTSASKASTASPAKSSASSTASAGTKTTVPLRAKVNDLAFGGNVWYAATEQGLMVSRDRGLNWTNVPLAPPQRPGTAAPAASGPQAIRTVRTGNSNSYVYVLTSSHLGVSGDAGSTWIFRTLPFLPAAYPHIQSSHDNTLILTGNHGVFVTRDAGESWRQASVSELLIDDITPVRNSVVVSTAKGTLFLSRDAGKTWAPMGSPGGDSSLSALRSRDEGNQLVAASTTEGLFVLDMGSTSSAAADEAPDSSATQQH